MKTNHCRNDQYLPPHGDNTILYLDDYRDKPAPRSAADVLWTVLFGVLCLSALACLLFL